MNNVAVIQVFVPGRVEPLVLEVSQRELLVEFRDKLTQELNSYAEGTPAREALEERVLNAELSDEQFEAHVLSTVFRVASEPVPVYDAENELTVYPSPERVVLRYRGGSSLVLPKQKKLILPN